MATKNIKKSARKAATSTKTTKTEKVSKKGGKTTAKTTAKTAEGKCTAKKGNTEKVATVSAVKTSSAKKSTDPANIGMDMARTISNTMGKYFSKFASVAVAAVIGLVAVNGCALISGMTVEQKADIAYTASRTATIAWVALDENSTKYVDALSAVVSITKKTVDSYCSETNTAFATDFYDKCYAVIEKDIVALNLDPLATEISKSLAKFSVLECQKVVKMMKAQTPEETKTLVQHIIDGIDSGLKVNVKSEEYKTALVEQRVANENEALRVKMTALGAKRK